MGRTSREEEAETVWAGHTIQEDLLRAGDERIGRFSFS